MAVVFQYQLSHFQFGSNERIAQIVYNNQKIYPTKAAIRL